MRLIITGGSGLIGQALIDDLLQDDHEVIVLSRTPHDHVSTLPYKVQLIGWDARSAEGWVHLVEGVDAIINLAGENIGGKSFLPPRWTQTRKQSIRDSRLNAGQAVLEAIQRVDDKPKLLIQASAVGFYGNQPQMTCTEETPIGTDFLARVCGQWEQATQPVEALGVRRIIIRTGILLDPKSGPLARFLLPFKFFMGAYYGTGEQWLPWIHPVDEVRAIRFLIEQTSASGPFNLAAPQPVTNQEFIRTLGAVLRKPAFVPVPAFAMRMLMGEVASLALEGQKAVPQALENLGFTFTYPSLKPALENLLR